MSTLAGRSLSEQVQARSLSTEARRLPLTSPSSDAALVTILLCTFNGEAFLEAQLASLERQAHKNWRLVVSDDGSTDATLSIIDDFAKRIPQSVEVRSGPRRGPATNFLSLAADPQIEGDYFAFCDQDDVWYAGKLSAALSRLQSIEDQKPAVYGGRTHLVTTAGRDNGLAPLFDKPPTFANALAQSIAGANTMVFNRAAKRLFERAGTLDVVSHDWWAYQLICGSGGVLIYDREPQLDYRQHSSNHIGCNRGWRAQWMRLLMILRGRFARWNDLNLAALEQSRHLLTDTARAELDTFKAIRSGSLTQRLRTFARSNIRRQSLLGNVAILIAILLKKL